MRPRRCRRPKIRTTWLFVAFDLNTAMRHREILHARFDQIDFDKLRPHVPEAKAGERDAFAPPDLMPESAVMEARQQILGLHLSEELEKYIVNVVVATRNPGAVKPELDGQVMYGASPRACMGIDRSARAHAWLKGRDYVGPEDIQEVAADVLRHRLVLSFEAEADGIEPDSIIQGVLDGVGVP